MKNRLFAFLLVAGCASAPQQSVTNIGVMGQANAPGAVGAFNVHGEAGSGGAKQQLSQETSISPSANISPSSPTGR